MVVKGRYADVKPRTVHRGRGMVRLTVSESSSPLVATYQGVKTARRAQESALQT